MRGIFLRLFVFRFFFSSSFFDFCFTVWDKGLLAMTEMFCWLVFDTMSCARRGPMSAEVRSRVETPRVECRSGSWRRVGMRVPRVA